jgi:uncharacterized membrane protein YdjX (TVP38/TMEM64 family)
MQSNEPLNPPIEQPGAPALSLLTVQRVLLLGLVVVGLALFYGLGFHRTLSWESIRAGLDDWQRLVQAYPVVSVCLFLVLYLVVTALSLPFALVLTLLAGALFGRWLGTGVVSIASTAGATLAFLLSRYLLREGIQRRFGTTLKSINEGVEREGAYYLFLLRLVPVVPFFLVNLGMGLTPIRLRTFIVVSWAGMLLGTFLYVNAGTMLATLDEPADLLSTRVLVSLALLGVVPLLLRKLVQWQVRFVTVIGGLATLLVCLVGLLGLRTYLRYQTPDSIQLPLTEYPNAEYPEDPATRSRSFGRYDSRTLTLIRKDETHFDFVLESDDPQLATIALRDVDVSLMTPGLPVWAKEHSGNQRIALTDRQWNRQQVRFPANAPQVSIEGGDGFERTHLVTVELAKNCLNAGLWEVLLFVAEGDKKLLHYHGWFTFPMGHYKRLFEHNTQLSYWKHWYYLEHWFDPAETKMDLHALRQVNAEHEVATIYVPDEAVLVAGEQINKQRILTAPNIRHWQDFYDGRKVRFASFIPPGRYSVRHPWKNEFWRMDQLEKVLLREIVSPATTRPLQEIEVVFRSSKTKETCRFFISGLDLSTIPQLNEVDYSRGVYMPMGIGVPPFFQSYEELRQSPPTESPFFSVLLDASDRWIDHHSVGVDGPVLHRDAKRPNRVHLYLLSYERHSLIHHLSFDLPR